MIINVRGTHGAGKTVLVRSVMNLYRKRKPVFIEGRRIPVGYICYPHLRKNKLFVVGSYEYPISGGCDNILKTEIMFDAIHKYAAKGYDVLFEGILAQHSTPRIQALHDAGYATAIVVLDVPFKLSVKGIKHRRKLRGETRPLNLLNATREFRAVINSAERLRDAGLIVKYPKTRSAALARVVSLLDL